MFITYDIIIIVKDDYINDFIDGWFKRRIY